MTVTALRRAQLMAPAWTRRAVILSMRDCLRARRCTRASSSIAAALKAAESQTSASRSASVRAATRAHCGVWCCWCCWAGSDCGVAPAGGDQSPGPL